jgi:ABC-type polysaccharide/polyol phosphate export permease
MASIIGGFRSVLFGTPAPAKSEVLLSAAVVVFVSIVGLAYFFREERHFADLI